MAILQRGRDNAAVFQVLEGYLVTADHGLVAAMLDAQMPPIAASLHRCLDAVLRAAQKAQTSNLLTSFAVLAVLLQAHDAWGRQASCALPALHH